MANSPLNIATRIWFIENQMLVQFDLNVGSYDFNRSTYWGYIEASHTKRCVGPLEIKVRELLFAEY